MREEESDVVDLASRREQKEKRTEDNKLETNRDFQDNLYVRLKGIPDARVQAETITKLSLFDRQESEITDVSMNTAVLARELIKEGKTEEAEALLEDQKDEENVQRENADVMAEVFRETIAEIQAGQYGILRVTGGIDSLKISNGAEVKDAADDGRVFIISSGAENILKTKFREVYSRRAGQGSDEQYLDQSSDFVKGSRFLSEDVGFTMHFKHGIDSEKLDRIFFLYGNVELGDEQADEAAIDDGNTEVGDQEYSKAA